MSILSYFLIGGAISLLLNVSQRYFNGSPLSFCYISLHFSFKSRFHGKILMYISWGGGGGGCCAFVNVKFGRHWCRIHYSCVDTNFLDCSNVKLFHLITEWKKWHIGRETKKFYIAVVFFSTSGRYSSKGHLKVYFFTVFDWCFWKDSVI
jgi:hypothetical protein